MARTRERVTFEVKLEDDDTIMLHVFEGRVCRLAIPLTVIEAFVASKRLWIASEDMKRRGEAQNG